MLFDISTNCSPVVTSGYISYTFGAFEKVKHALVSHDCSTNVTGDMSGSIDISTNVGAGTGVTGDQAASANNVVQVYVFKTVSGQRTAATTADLAGKKFTVFAVGE